jgi:hypothetical protein
LTVLAALAAEAVGLGGTQSPIGIGMGAGVGILQARRLHGVVADSRAWVGTTMGGLTAPFLAVDLANVAGIAAPYSLSVCVALGGLAVGLLQATRLQSLFARPSLWVAASTAGWTLAGACAALADYLPKTSGLRGLPGAATFLAIAISGGAVLGIVTSFPWSTASWAAEAERKTTR